jgi:hypothetical protein
VQPAAVLLQLWEPAMLLLGKIHLEVIARELERSYKKEYFLQISDLIL